MDTHPGFIIMIFDLLQRGYLWILRDAIYVRSETKK